MLMLFGDPSYAYIILRTTKRICIITVVPPEKMKKKKHTNNIREPSQLGCWFSLY